MRVAEPLKVAATAGVAAWFVGCSVPEGDGPCVVGTPTYELTLPSLPSVATGVSEGHLADWIERLASPETNGRRAGTGDAPPVAAALAAHLERLGWPAPYPGGYCQAFRVLGVREVNVLTLAEGAAAEAPIVLLTAHYDGQGRHPSLGHLPGADDDASGVAALAEAARLLRPGALPVGVGLAFLGAEEVGRLGAARFLEETPFDAGRIALVVSLDMVGRPWPQGSPQALGVLAGGPTPEASRRLAELAAQRARIEVAPLESLGTSAPDLGGTDAGVLARRWPTILVSTGLHADHHGAGDLPERVDLGQIVRATEWILAVIALVSEEATGGAGSSVDAVG